MGAEGRLICKNYFDVPLEDAPYKTASQQFAGVVASGKQNAQDFEVCFFDEGLDDFVRFLGAFRTQSFVCIGPETYCKRRSLLVIEPGSVLFVFVLSPPLVRPVPWLGGMGSKSAYPSHVKRGPAQVLAVVTLMLPGRPRTQGLLASPLSQPEFFCRFIGISVLDVDSQPFLLFLEVPHNILLPTARQHLLDCRLEVGQDLLILLDARVKKLLPGQDLLLTNFETHTFLLLLSPGPS
jgi:hypothetical protein